MSLVNRLQLLVALSLISSSLVQVGDAVALRSVPDVKLWQQWQPQKAQRREDEEDTLAILEEEEEERSLWQRMMATLGRVMNTSTWLWPRDKKDDDPDVHQEEQRETESKKSFGPLVLLQRMKSDLMSWLPSWSSDAKDESERSDSGSLLHPEMYKTHFGKSQQLIAAESVGIPYDLVLLDNEDQHSLNGQVQPYTFVRPRHKTSLHQQTVEQPQPLLDDQLLQDVGVQDDDSRDVNRVDGEDGKKTRSKKLGLLDTLTVSLLRAKDWLMKKSGLKRSREGELKEPRTLGNDQVVEERIQEDEFHSKPYQTDFEPAFFTF